MHKGTIRTLVAATMAVVLAALALAVSAPSAGAARPLLRATLLDKDGGEVGEVVFKGAGTEVTRVEVELHAGSAAFGSSDFHGFHIHTIGVCDPDPAATPAGATPAVFGSAGGHWNPTGSTHGSHTGDLPSVLMHSDGEGYAELETDRFDVSEVLDGNGAAVVLHAGRDNFANIPSTYSSGGVPGPNTATNNTGDAGGRYACGVVVAA
jgi:Cu-Zn family superoxide dismutase